MPLEAGGYPVYPDESDYNPPEGVDDMRVGVDVLLGKTLTEIQRIGDDELIFRTTEGPSYRMFHSQDCCECVYIEDIIGSLDDLIGSPLLLSEEVSEDLGRKAEQEESYTWTFYKFATIRGSVTIRWYGSSNGYYSESVDFEKIGA
jgi:hypothetical protein